jgi:signal peptidase
MFLVLSFTRLARRTLDVLLLVVIGVVLAILVVARVLPAITGGSTLVVGGPSMEPTIPLGSVVLAIPVDPADLQVGDIVSVRMGPANAMFTHRIVRTAMLPAGLHFETRGDANEDPDPSLVPASRVIGRMTFSLPFAGYALSALGSIQGAMLALSLSLALLAGAWLLESAEADQYAAIRRRAQKIITRRYPERAAQLERAGGSGVAG